MYRVPSAVFCSGHRVSTQFNLGKRVAEGQPEEVEAIQKVLVQTGESPSDSKELNDAIGQTSGRHL